MVEAPLTNYLLIGWKSETQDDCEDCVDMVIGMTMDGKVKIEDCFAWMRSRPRVDSFWGGNNDLTDEHIWNSNGSTWLMFRRKRVSKITDVSLEGKKKFTWSTNADDVIPLARRKWFTIGICPFQKKTNFRQKVFSDFSPVTSFASERTINISLLYLILLST